SSGGNLANSVSRRRLLSECTRIIGDGKEEQEGCQLQGFRVRSDGSAAGLRLEVTASAVSNSKGRSRLPSFSPGGAGHHGHGRAGRHRSGAGETGQGRRQRRLRRIVAAPPAAGAGPLPAVSGRAAP